MNLVQLFESDMSGVMHAARHHNKSFIITANVDGAKKKFRVNHQTADLAKDKFLQHHSMAKILDVQQDGVTEVRDRRDAYQRDYDSSVSGMGNRQSRAYRQDGGGNDERHDLDPSDWYFVKDGKMFAVSVYPNQEQQAISLGYSRTRAEAKAKAGQQGVAEGSDNITAVFSGYGNYMKGRAANVFKHYGITVLGQQYDEDEDIVEYTVSGSKEALDQARAYLERSDQFGGMILKQGVAEGLSKRDQKDVDAINATIARLEAQLNHPNADKDAIQQSIAHEKKRLALYKQGVAEGFNAEYNDEAGMADNNLETLKRAVQGLDNIITAGDNLPEWCQEKIAVSKSMLVSVWDYMLSEKEKN